MSDSYGISVQDYDDAIASTGTYTDIRDASSQPVPVPVALVKLIEKDLKRGTSVGTIRAKLEICDVRAQLITLLLNTFVTPEATRVFEEYPLPIKKPRMGDPSYETTYITKEDLDKREIVNKMIEEEKEAALGEENWVGDAMDIMDYSHALQNNTMENMYAYSWPRNRRYRRRRRYSTRRPAKRKRSARRKRTGRRQTRRVLERIKRDDGVTIIHYIIGGKHKYYVKKNGLIKGKLNHMPTSAELSVILK